jgi:LacI family transcriptional regulator
MRAVLDARLSVPDDVAIIGSGNVHYSDLLRVPLSTIDQDSFRIGQTAAGLLTRCIESKKEIPPPEHMIIAPKLVVRQSSQRKALA